MKSISANIMLEDFLSYITVHFSAFKGNKILIAVSGGIDSMVLLHLSQTCKLDFGVAHVNHSTRNEQSDKDEAFIREYCLTHNIPYYSTKLAYETLNKGNFQNNARNARYTFFKKIIKSQNYDVLATAHHMEDRWETFLMHLNRKAGINGLSSMRVRENNIVRPLLGFSKKDIIQYATLHNIPFVHDISNDTDDYVRNTIRHHISPRLEATFPSFIENVNQSINHINSAYKLLVELIDNLDFIHLDEKQSVYAIPLQKIESIAHSKELLYHLVSPFNFNSSDVEEMLTTKRTGAYWKSPSHEAIFDRNRILIRKKTEKVNVRVLVAKIGDIVLEDGRTLKVRNAKDQDAPSKIIATDKLVFPVIIRSVQNGDKYQPIGMHGKHKTIKKFCSDNKIDRFTKEMILVAEQDNSIIALINYHCAAPYNSKDKKGIIIEIE